MNSEVNDGEAMKGLRIVDLGIFVAGPFAATLLADFGAEVIKVEMPGVGDHLRRHGPSYKGVGYWWTQDARNKKSITVDMHKPAGQEIIKRLAAVSDVILENFRPGALEGWNLGYDVLSQINPRIILARTTGFGQTGPYRRRAGMAGLGEATGGLRELVGNPDGPPAYPGIAWGDYAAGLFGAVGILTALYNRDRTGLGQVVDTSICEAVFRLMEYHPLAYSAEGYVPHRMGLQSPRKGGMPGALLSKDGKYVQTAIPTDRIFARLAEALGMPEVTKDPRFATIGARQQNSQALFEILQAWVSQHTAKEAEAALDEAEVPVATTYDMTDIFNDPYFTIRGDLVEWDHPVWGKVKTQGPVPKLSRTPGEVKQWGPELGEHNEEILGGLLGYSQEELVQLKAEGVISLPTRSLHPVA